MRDRAVQRLLREKVGPRGGVVGIEESPEMAAAARERIAREGWPNATVVQSPAGDARIPVTADAALFCAVHDILQSPGALRNVMNHLRPGAQVAAEQLIEDVHVRELAFGSGYILTGRSSRSRRPGSRAVPGRGRIAGQPG